MRKPTPAQVARWRREHKLAVRQLVEVRLAYTALVEAYDRMRDLLSESIKTIGGLRDAIAQMADYREVKHGASDGGKVGRG